MNLSKLIIKWFSIVLLSMVSVESFAALQSHQQKFISKVLIEVRQANQEVQIRRAELKTLHHKWQTNHNLSAQELNKVEQLAALYRISGTNFSTEATWQKLLQRIDVLPESLVLAQAINESAWGKSRIAKSSNNFFGRSCFKTGCGLKPGKNNG
ncbi:MAG: glucosaminidase domain-containing protein, partial [Pseudomonadota bacterium]|nr:glucosaminidase domain-containing protein [Pseudomonadota bacterium]